MLKKKHIDIINITSKFFIFKSFKSIHKKQTDVNWSETRRSNSTGPHESLLNLFFVTLGDTHKTTHTKESEYNVNWTITKMCTIEDKKKVGMKFRPVGVVRRTGLDELCLLIGAIGS